MGSDMSVLTRILEALPGRQKKAKAAFERAMGPLTQLQRLGAPLSVKDEAAFARDLTPELAAQLGQNATAVIVALKQVAGREGGFRVPGYHVTLETLAREGIFERGELPTAVLKPIDQPVFIRPIERRLPLSAAAQRILAWAGFGDPTFEIEVIDKGEGQPTSFENDVTLIIISALQAYAAARHGRGNAAGDKTRKNAVKAEVDRSSSVMLYKGCELWTVDPESKIVVVMKGVEGPRIKDDVGVARDGEIGLQPGIAVNKSFKPAGFEELSLYDLEARGYTIVYLNSDSIDCTGNTAVWQPGAEHEGGMVVNLATTRQLNEVEDMRTQSISIALRGQHRVDVNKALDWNLEVARRATSVPIKDMVLAWINRNRQAEIQRQVEAFGSSVLPFQDGDVEHSLAVHLSRFDAAMRIMTRFGTSGTVIAHHGSGGNIEHSWACLTARFAGGDASHAIASPELGKQGKWAGRLRPLDNGLAERLARQGFVDSDPLISRGPEELYAAGARNERASSIVAFVTPPQITAGVEETRSDQKGVWVSVVKIDFPSSRKVRMRVFLPFRESKEAADRRLLTTVNELLALPTLEIESKVAEWQREGGERWRDFLEQAALTEYYGFVSSGRKFAVDIGKLEKHYQSQEEMGAKHIAIARALLQHAADRFLVAT